MKKKIAILGSTGSIGKYLLKIVAKEKQNFQIQLLTANKNYKELLKQTQKFNVKNVIITDPVSNKNFRKENKNKVIKIFDDFDCFSKIFKNKIDYTMSSIVGLAGLYPTLNIIEYTNTIAIANKESIICGWNLINKKLLKYKTKFIPVDSEHFSIWYALKENKNLIDKIFLTASGGPFLNLHIKNFKKIKINDALKHPNWKMGKKISIDSATMMNKVFEVIEAKKVFNISYKKLSIFINPNSYLHAIVEFKNGIIELIAHNTNMMIPIYNSLFDTKKKLNFSNKQIQITKLNKLDLRKVNFIKFPSVKILKKMPNKNSLFETILVTANDELVNQFLNKKIKFNQIISKLTKILDNKKFSKYKHISPQNIKEILKLNHYVRLKIRSNDI
ncbi:1-deoxy-D-xylulose-5-phosphate reductoisomerase [Candidatus Pelagibacter communis]|uniref:1-deoxy-D-xylulose-5-phosphate reductoisomerase n=1 Tax=Pelagibacter ubique TaxID=198252 RepID=UPI00065B3EA2|nr:1-deoxy-D-xylulose-5-phosphate reductoisomerase [Candidatus Pelagibacter ubique]